MIVEAGRLVGSLTPVAAPIPETPASPTTAATTSSDTPSSPSVSISTSTSTPSSPNLGPASPRAATTAAIPGMNVAVTTMSPVSAPAPGSGGGPPMLERKVTISSLSAADHNRPVIPEKKDDDDSVGTWKAVCNVIKAVASRLEEPTKVAAIDRGLVSYTALFCTPIKGYNGMRV
jgi:hypothetical protein